MKELSPPSISLKTLYHETLATEPVLVVISPGADPSQELQDLASEIVGLERYHQVTIYFHAYITLSNVPFLVLCCV